MRRKLIAVFFLSLFLIPNVHTANKKKQGPEKKSVTKTASKKNKQAEKKDNKTAPVKEEKKRSDFKITKIEFTGVKRTPSEMLKKISSKYMSAVLYEDWTEKMIQEIQSIPIVREAHLMKSMTGTVTIEIKEREPIAYLYLDQYYWMDELGKVIQSIESNQLENKIFFSGPWKNVSDFEKKNGSETIVQGIKFYTQLLSHDFAEKKISEIHFDANLGWMMYRVGSRAPVVFGTQNLSQKIERFTQVVPQITPMETSISRIDADFNDRVVVKLTSPGKEVGSSH